MTEVEATSVIRRTVCGTTERGRIATIAPCEKGVLTPRVVHAGSVPCRGRIHLVWRCSKLQRVNVPPLFRTSRDPGGGCVLPVG